MTEEIKENWKYLLINGKSKTLEVKDPKFDKGKLVSISEIRNYPKKDSEDNVIEQQAF